MAHRQRNRSAVLPALLVLAAAARAGGQVAAPPPAPPAAASSEERAAAAAAEPRAATASGASAPSSRAAADDRGIGELRYDLRLDLPLTIAGGAAWLATELLRHQLAPAACRWCDRNANGTDGLNGFDAGARAALRWGDTGGADTASSVLAFAVVPLLAVGLDAAAAAREGGLRRPGRTLGVDVLLMAEAAVAAADVNQLVKFAAGRERPFVHALANADKARTADPSDNNTSFYSGHTNLAFALAVSAGTIASLRRYRLAPLVWAVGLSAASAVGYLRIAADRHYLSDVLVGAAAGAAMGFAVPWLFHSPSRKRAVNLSVTSLPAGAGLSLSGVF